MNRVIIALAAVMLAATPALAQSVRPLAGTVIMARAGASPLYVWNATPYVAQLGTDKMFGDPGLHAIEATAVTTLAEKAKSQTSSTIAIRVVYEKTGAVSPLYRTATFEGLEDVLTITADRKALLASASPWVTSLQAGKSPQGLTIAVTGALPTPY
jgi:hypothetical protein